VAPGAGSRSRVPLEEHAAQQGELAESRSFAQPDRVLQQRETAGLVWQALGQLPFDQRRRSCFGRFTA
jgi:hypothetical protein